MHARGDRRLYALLLLGLMAFFTLPRTWFHHCDGAEVHAVADGGVVVHADDHCPICQQLGPTLIADAVVPALSGTEVSVELASLVPTSPLLEHAFGRPSRGPPVKG